MTYRILTCKQDHEWQRCIEFLLRHRLEIHPKADFPTYFQVLTNLFHHGEAIIALDQEEQIKGTVAYTYGTPENQYEDPQQVRIEFAYIEENYRCTLLFYQGFQQCVRNLAHAEPSIHRIECFTPNGNPVLQKLMLKFNHYQATLTTLFGIEDQYQTPFEQWGTRLWRIELNKK